MLLIILFIIKETKEGFQSYAFPWYNRGDWSWNWWRRWYKKPMMSWKPRCPVGCKWTGDKYGCPGGSFCYGDYCCKYDFECKDCNWAYDGPRTW